MPSRTRLLRHTDNPKEPQEGGSDEDSDASGSLPVDGSHALEQDAIIALLKSVKDLHRQVLQHRAQTAAQTMQQQHPLSSAISSAEVDHAVDSASTLLQHMGGPPSVLMLGRALQQLLQQLSSAAKARTQAAGLAHSKMQAYTHALSLAHSHMQLQEQALASPDADS